MPENVIVQDFVDEYKRYRDIGERALAQISDEGLNRVIATDGNSAAMVVRHVSGNLKSRFTDFLTADGEKEWRRRDEEFADRGYTRDEVMKMWAEGWEVLEREAGALTDADLTRSVTIRQQPLSVHAALSRSLAHTAYHVGQIVLLARVSAESQWRWISIPKGGSREYNQQPTMEKGFK